MTAPVGLGLARVTVSAPKRRIDVALPDNALVGELLPQLLRHAGEETADGVDDGFGWRLRRGTGAVLELNRNLTVQGVRDGEVLHLVPGGVTWPELAYDDVVEVIAAGARQAGRSWGNEATRRCTLAVAAAVLSVGLVVILTSGLHGVVPGVVALSAAVALSLAGLLLARAVGDAGAGAVVAGAGLPYALVGGALVNAPANAGLTTLPATELMLGFTALLVLSVLGFVAVNAVQRIFLAGIAIAVCGLIGNAMSIAGMSDTGSAALILTLVLALLPAYPLISGWLGRLPVPTLPDRPEAILDDQPTPPRASVFTAVAKATEQLNGLLLATAVVGVACAGILIASGDTTAEILALAASAAMLLRGRLFPAPAQRVPLLVAGGLVATLLFLGLVWRQPSGSGRLVLLVVILVATVLILVAGLAYSRRTPSPYLGRIADIADVIAIMALLPLACGVVGIYSAVQSMFASFGS